MNKPRQSCTFRRQLRQQTKLGSKQLEECRGQALQTRPPHPSNTRAPHLRMKTAMTWTSQRPGRADSVRRNSSAAFATHRSDSSQTLEGHAPLKVCLTASHKSRGPASCSSHPQVAFHLDACAGSVLTPHDYITNVQKRLGNRVWVGGAQCRCCVSFVDPQLEHAETCSTAEATREHYACAFTPRSAA